MQKCKSTRVNLYLPLWSQQRRWLFLHRFRDTGQMDRNYYSPAHSNWKPCQKCSTMLIPNKGIPHFLRTESNKGTFSEISAQNSIFFVFFFVFEMVCRRTFELYLKLIFLKITQKFRQIAVVKSYIGMYSPIYVALRVINPKQVAPFTVACFSLSIENTFQLAFSHRRSINVQAWYFALFRIRNCSYKMTSLMQWFFSLTGEHLWYSDTK